MRAASLLSIEQEAEYSTIFKTIYSLYDRRSKVIHGVTDVKLDKIEIFHFQKCLREAIKRFIHIEMPKKGILKLLDDSVFDQDKKKMLKEIILEAQKKW